MKIITIILAGILLASSQVFADLSVSDLEKIESIVKDSEARMKEYVSGEIEKVDTKLTEMEKRLTKSIFEVEERSAFHLHIVDKKIRSCQE